MNYTETTTLDLFDQTSKKVLETKAKYTTVPGNPQNIGHLGETLTGLADLKDMVSALQTKVLDEQDAFFQGGGGKHKYHATAKGLMMWANSELEHVGRIAAVEDPDLQYSYAMSTLNGMAHLKDALYEFVTERSREPMSKDLKIVHDKVIRVMKHLIKDYNLDLQTILDFNTKKVLSSLNYLKNQKKTRKQKK